MKNTFYGYYRPSEEDFSQLWQNCLFVLDANVLLNIYRYTPPTRQTLIEIFTNISDRLWVPYQAALEYQQNRLDVINHQMSAYGNIQDILNKNKNRLISDLKVYSKHPFIKIDSFTETVEITFSEIVEEIHKMEEGHPNLFNNDELRDTITTILEGKIGSDCPKEILEKIFEIGKIRYQNKIPPGFNDNHKEGNEKYGDLVLWFQIIEHAKSIKQPIIFITDDKKDDWWRKFNGQIVAPQPELIREMYLKSGEKFYMYQTAQFMEHADKFLKSHIKLEEIEEVRRIRVLDDNSKEHLINAVEDLLMKQKVREFLENKYDSDIIKSQKFLDNNRKGQELIKNLNQLDASTLNEFIENLNAKTIEKYFQNEILDSEKHEE